METAVQALTRRLRRTARWLNSSTVIVLAVSFLCSGALAQTAADEKPGAAAAESKPGAAEAARVLSAGDHAFREGRVDLATATFRTLKGFFPNWWIPGAKFIVARRQGGMKLDTVISGLEGLTDLEPTGFYLPMLLTLAAGERLSPEDVEHLRRLSAAETAKPRAPVDFRKRTMNGDLDSRYQFARAMALEAAGLLALAEAEYRWLIESRPFAVTPRVRLAGLLRRQDRLREAADVLDGIEGSSLLPSRIRVLGGRRDGGKK